MTINSTYNWPVEGRRDIASEIRAAGNGDELVPEDVHTCTWGEVEHSVFAGTPHRKCTDAFCDVISLDLNDDDEGESE